MRLVFCSHVILESFIHLLVGATLRFWEGNYTYGVLSLWYMEFTVTQIMYFCHRRAITSRVFSAAASHFVGAFSFLVWWCLCGQSQLLGFYLAVCFSWVIWVFFDWLQVILWSNFGMVDLSTVSYHSWSSVFCLSYFWLNIVFSLISVLFELQAVLAGKFGLAWFEQWFDILMNCCCS